jgi:parallel beta-helix repeat protein
VDADTTGLILNDAYDYTEVEDLQFQYCANEAQKGMLTLSGSHCVLSKCLFLYGAGAGLSFGGANNQVNNCTFNYNTQEGFNSSSGSITTMSGCISNYNNTEPDKVFDSGWEAGGNKVSRSDRFIIKNHTSVGNNGPGIWFDVDNQDATIEDCTCTQNKEGIQYEISYTALIINNICAYNTDDGFLISSSAGNYVANNLAYSNTDFGITSVDADAPRGDGNGNFVYCYANTFYNNIIASNQIAGNQKSYVVNSSTTVESGLGSDPVIPFSPNYSDYNLFYYSGPAEPFFIDQKDHYEPDTLAEWQAHNGYDLHSIWAENPLLVNPSGGNYALQAGSPAINTGLTLSEVPVDIIGTARPQGGAYDMGPYEYIAP